jgi:hypothetical protein
MGYKKLGRRRSSRSSRSTGVQEFRSSGVQEFSVGEPRKLQVKDPYSEYEEQPAGLDSACSKVRSPELLQLLELLNSFIHPVDQPGESR